MKKNLITIGKVAVTLALVFWLIERVEWSVVKTELAEVSWALLFLYVLLQVLGNIISVSNWRNIALYKGLSFGLKEGFFAFMTGAFINNFLPSTIGGDAYRGLWLARKTGARAAALSTVVFHRFIGLFTTALLALVLSFVLWEYVFTSAPLLITLLALFAFLVLDLMLTILHGQPWFQGLVEKIPFQKVRRLSQEIVFYTTKKIWTETSVRAALFVFVGVGLTNYTLFQALGNDIPFLSFLAVIFLVVIVSSIPISIGNIGIKEWAYVVFFGLIGVSVETAVTVALLSRFIQMLISFVALPQYLSSRTKDVTP
mgnify:CR=1 FL=1